MQRKAKKKFMMKKPPLKLLDNTAISLFGTTTADQKKRKDITTDISAFNPNVNVGNR
jgi:hypothetical protein